jgi:hypothetical protein
MKHAFSILFLALTGTMAGSAAVLKHSDVVFMYQAGRAVYADYGGTVLAWGGKPTPAALAETQGVKFFGSVGMVTEFSRYYERFPQTYEQALCRDVDGKPVKVPWLTDHQHKGIPYWWCCTQQPQFRQYIRERVIETVRAGADGVHIDDHLGTSGGLWLGICFCDRCVEGFSAYLKSLPKTELQRLAIDRPGSYNYRETLVRWLGQGSPATRKVTQHPLWTHWSIYQNRAAAAFMQELRELAAKTAGHPVPVGANAGLLWPRHLSDHQALDLFSAEILHQAERKQASDLPLFAYRLADAVDRPLAATASGQDWAFIKENNLPGLVRCWIALSYAAGQSLMTPCHQWCYTAEKGTHWYNGPAEKFAPLYRFVRRYAAWFDDYDNFADLTVLLPHRAYVKNADRWFAIGNQLAAANLSYRLWLGGDEIVDHPLPAGDLRKNTPWLLTDTNEFLPADQQQVQSNSGGKTVYRQVQDAMAAIRPAVSMQTEGRVRILPRVKPGSAVVHLVNFTYDPAVDDVRPQKKVIVQVDRRALGVEQAPVARWLTPSSDPVDLQVVEGKVTIPQLDLWGILVFDARR